MILALLIRDDKAGDWVEVMTNAYIQHRCLCSGIFHLFLLALKIVLLDFVQVLTDLFKPVIDIFKWSSWPRNPLSSWSGSSFRFLLPKLRLFLLMLWHLLLLFKRSMLRNEHFLLCFRHLLLFLRLVRLPSGLFLTLVLPAALDTLKLHRLLFYHSESRYNLNRSMCSCKLI